MSINEPPAGSTPPPGEPTPPPPPPPQVPAPGGNAAWSVGDALSYGWTKFQATWQPFVLAAGALLVGFAVLVVLYVVVQAAVIGDVTTTINDDGTIETSGGGSFLTSLVLSAVFVGLLIVVSLVVGAMLIRAALDVTEGKAVTTASVLKLPDLGPVVVTALIVGGLTLVGTILCYLPGLIVGFFTQFALYFVLDKGLSPVDAVKASVQLCRDNLGNAIVWYVVAAIVGGIGAVVCGVGILVTYPIALIGTAYTYKSFTHQPVAA